jgi:hypothetical protein
MRRDVFHTATIGGCVFDAVILDTGPHISSRQGGGLALGVSILRFFKPRYPYPERSEEGWWIAKYGNDALIELVGFNKDQVIELAEEFGIAFWAPSEHSTDSYWMGAFYQGKAWDSLKNWVKVHPKLAKKLSHGAAYYLPYWYDIAMGFRPIFTIEPDEFRDKFLAEKIYRSV